MAKGFFSYVTNTQAYQQKSENEEKQSLVGLTLGVGNLLLAPVSMFVSVRVGKRRRFELNHSFHSFNQLRSQKFGLGVVVGHFWPQKIYVK
jgi:hypothetical protein